VFLGKLNVKTGEKGGKFVLPTEAQWEYACRAGSTTRYCFGDDEKQLSEYAWYVDNSGDETHPVGKKRPNAWGLFGMHGNVSEWCQDWYASDYYRKSPLNDPQGPTRGTDRVNRGGCCGAKPEDCRSACRGDEAPGLSLDYIGFRVARVSADK
jgi:formylglycine-generating enzyme required for sulfatase activity